MARGDGATLEPAIDRLQDAPRENETAQMTGSKVLVAVRVAATPDEAFDAFISEIGSWWQPNPLFQFTPRSPGVVRFEGQAGGRFVEELPDGKVFEIGRIKIWEPGARVVFGWRQAAFRPDQNTE